ncbi:hypothetical protein R50072_28330 [Simiduia litorea]|uniref:hypothetical protein n=1 Tax=Simiduia litorea TaxID=1435348 RepID=UPI0036F41FB3
MNCFTHSEECAVAVCKACGKAICHGCTIDLGHAVACSDRCKVEAEELHQMNAKAKRIYGLGGAKKLSPLAPLIWLLIASPFIFLLISVYMRKGTIEWFALIFIGACIVIGLISWRRNRALELNC